MRKIVLTFGLIGGALLSAMMLITLRFSDHVSFEKGAVLGYTTMVLAFLMVFFGVRSYRDNVAGGTVTFGRALKVGLMITLITSLCYVATWELVYFKLAPDFSRKYAEHAMEMSMKAGATPAELAVQKQKTADFQKMYQNPLINAALTLLEPLPVGLLFTLVAAGVLSRKRTTAGTPPNALNRSTV